MTYYVQPQCCSRCGKSGHNRRRCRALFGRSPAERFPDEVRTKDHPLTVHPDLRLSQPLNLLVSPKTMRRLDQLRAFWSRQSNEDLSRTDVIRSILERELPPDSKRAKR